MIDDDGPERDWHQEHKDDVAMGYIDEDGHQLDMDPDPDGYDPPADLDDDPRLWTGESMDYPGRSFADPKDGD